MAVNARKLFEMFKEAGILGDGDWEEIESMRKQAVNTLTLKKVTKGLRDVIYPTVVAAATYPALKQVYEELAAPALKSKRFDKMMKRYGDRLTQAQIPEKEDGYTVKMRPATEEDVREAFEVGYDLAPNLMGNPTLAYNVTSQMLETLGRPKMNIVSDVVRAGAEKSRAGSRAAQGLSAMQGIANSMGNDYGRRLDEAAIAVKRFKDIAPLLSPSERESLKTDLAAEYGLDVKKLDTTS